MNHSQLRAFHSVAREGSFTRAAAALRVSQPTLSGHVGALEEGYGITLFNRGGRGIELTDIGRTLLAATERYFACEAEVEHLLTRAKGLVKGRLRVGADSPHHTLPLLAAFGRRYPAVDKVLTFGNSSTIVDDLHRNRIDVGIFPEVRSDDRLFVARLKVDRLVIIVNRNHAWAQRRSIRLADLVAETVLLREKGSTTRAVFEAALAALDVRLGDVLEIGSREAVREAVAAGLGVGVVGEGEFGHDLRLHKLTASDSRLRVVEYAVCRAGEQDGPAVAAFLELVRETAAVSA